MGYLYYDTESLHTELTMPNVFQISNQNLGKFSKIRSTISCTEVCMIMRPGRNKKISYTSKNWILSMNLFSFAPAMLQQANVKTMPLRQECNIINNFSIKKAIQL